MEEKNLQLERTVFFCDAVVAIAITLLALNIKIEHTKVPGQLSFSDIIAEWKTFAAFFLSFINIANFWKAHHTFYSYIKKMDERLLWFNISWLFLIVLLPFSTSLVSNYFNTPALFVYTLNVLLISCCQNLIWDYANLNPGFIKEQDIEESMRNRLRLFCNLDMINGIIAIIVSFINPLVAFIFLFTKLPMIIMAGIFFRHQKDLKRKKGLGDKTGFNKMMTRGRRHKENEVD